MTRTQPAPEEDLFGNPVEAAVPVKRTPPRHATNDVDLIESVLKVARNEGYVVTGLNTKVYRIEGTQGGTYEVATVPVYEADAVCQLIDLGVLNVGGAHPCRYRNNRESTCNAVLVPSITRRKADRWAALQRPGNWKPANEYRKDASA
ncbi:MAG TPA: hypothetical protein VHX38_15170 [Pseudonocardiaceae bacterium]|jgi:hypothetical protein|nr:hypothetical protein [Pseudonocardiaceae bacterium]